MPEITITTLPIYDGPWEVYALDPTMPTYARQEPTQHFVHTSLVVDSVEYDNAIRVYVDGIEKDESFYLNIENAEGLIEMLKRDIEKLKLIAKVDPTSR